MLYYYFNPFNRQYYFPECFQEYEAFNSFYQPYTFSGSLIWFLWKKSELLRSFCLEKSPETFLPIQQLRKHISGSSVLAFNRGTPGIEQKITILGYDTDKKDSFFIKYAQSPIARKNVDNEGNTLQQLSHLGFIPQLQLQVSGPDYSLIRTNLLKGDRLTNQRVEQQLLGVLLQLSRENINTDRDYTTDLKNCLAHGDFCPWNIMVYHNQLSIFDWEMAGYYPAGYDLFTYIFQTSFLLSPKLSSRKILSRYNTLINKYFESLNLNSWQPYLISFATLKLKLETQKGNRRLMNPYQQLLMYATQL